MVLKAEELLENARAGTLRWDAACISAKAV